MRNGARRTALLLLCGSLIAGISGCSATNSAAPSPSQPTRVDTAGLSRLTVVTDYYRAITVRDYQRAFGYLAPDATGPGGSRLTLRTFRQLAGMLDGQGGPVTRFSVGVFPSVIVMTIYRARIGPYHAHLRMVRTRHGWMIGSLDRI